MTTQNANSLSAVDRKFMDYADEFLELVMLERAPTSRGDLQLVTTRRPFAVPPVLIADYRAMTKAEKEAVIQGY